MNKENKSNESIPQGGQQIIINQVEKKSNGVGTAGFVLALIGFLFGWIPLIGFFLGGGFWLLGLILSFAGVFKKPRGLAITGLILSLGNLFILIFVTGAVILGIGAGAGALNQATKDSTKAAIENTVQSNSEQRKSVASEQAKRDSKFFEENLYESPKNKGEKGRISKNHPLVKFLTEKGDTYIRAKINNGSAEYLDEGMYMLDGFYISYGYEEETSLYARYPKDNCEFYDNHYYDKDGNTLLLE